MIKDFALAFAIEGVKDALKGFLPPTLETWGAERLRSMAQLNISFWEAWPDKAAVLKEIAPYREVLKAIPEDLLLQVIGEVIRENKPEYSFLPATWVLKGIREMKRDLEQAYG